MIIRKQLLALFAFEAGLNIIISIVGLLHPDMLMGSFVDNDPAYMELINSTSNEKLYFMIKMLTRFYSVVLFAMSSLLGEFVYEFYRSLTIDKHREENRKKAEKVQKRAGKRLEKVMFWLGIGDVLQIVSGLVVAVDVGLVNLFYSAWVAVGISVVYLVGRVVLVVNYL
eukprot:TRINITY_DN9467_c0_g1_i1.p1 TRINITY_DN9467_c0_g1~~TRINITY_DN9467_c0_g1_i1.p1  ORF type:complete len:169 (-),score=21.29 TRINITY_DN9467_c0_g1_i1:208-714(-)